MGSPHLEKIKLLIAKSLILQEHEREEWLLMAETMNDKQLSDLESILAQDKSAVVAVPPTQNFPQAQPRPLSHLQNAPKSVTLPPVMPAPQVPLSKPSPQQPLLVLNARKTAPPPSAPLPQKPLPVKPFPVTPPIQASEPARSAVSPVSQQSAPAATPSLKPQTDHSGKAVLDDLRTITLKKPELAGMETSVAISTIKSLSDASRVNLKVLRSLGREAVLSGLRQLLPSYSYHDVMFAVEQSPVYQLFLLTGNKLLQSGTPVTILPESDSESMLSQEEFGFLTELPWLLRKRS